MDGDSSFLVDLAELACISSFAGERATRADRMAVRDCIPIAFGKVDGKPLILSLA